MTKLRAPQVRIIKGNNLLNSPRKDMVCSDVHGIKYSASNCTQWFKFVIPVTRSTCHMLVTNFRLAWSI